MLSDKSPEFAISTIAAAFYRFGSQVSLLYHAPIRIKVVRENYPVGEKEQDHGDLQQLLNSSLLVRTRNPCPLCGPRKSSVPGRVQNESTFMVGCQHCLAHGVVSKDGDLGLISGVERLTNQLSWLSQF